ncbi:hypothetical protein DFJ74DRAFT_716424 [Hyaloraphidium curvatum]|nr:hypothetical protein DFJ74DRAFT_716424 [Hyaloraphidium curvatum]
MRSWNPPRDRIAGGGVPCFAVQGTMAAHAPAGSPWCAPFPGASRAPTTSLPSSTAGSAPRRPARRRARRSGERAGGSRGRPAGERGPRGGAARRKVPAAEQMPRQTRLPTPLRGKKDRKGSKIRKSHGSPVPFRGPGRCSPVRANLYQGALPEARNMKEVLITVHAGALAGFKALPAAELPTLEEAASAAEARASFAAAASAATAVGGTADWTAIYPQLDVIRAAAYLPNLWDRGNSSAVIVALVLRTHLKLLIVSDPHLADGTMPSSEKAGRVREVYRTAAGPSGTLLDHTVPLMESLGRLGIALALPDSEPGSFELAIPTSLFHRGTFDVQPLFRMEQSTKLHLTTGSVWHLPSEERLVIRKDELADPAALGAALEAECSRRRMPGRCDELLQMIDNALAES